MQQVYGLHFCPLTGARKPDADCPVSRPAPALQPPSHFCSWPDLLPSPATHFPFRLPTRPQLPESYTQLREDLLSMHMCPASLKQGACIRGTGRQESIPEEAVPVCPEPPPAQ